MNNKKNILKVIAFLFIGLLIFTGLNKFFNRDWNAEALNIYDEPKDTIETLFIGSSMTEFGIDVMTLYEEYGICAFNLGNSGQPVSQSYFWLLEAYKTQSGSLKTVVFDVSIMKSHLQEEHYRSATENMNLSMLKYEAVDSYTNDFDQTISYLFPTFSYHTRWDKLTSADFGVPNSMLYQWSRGQCFSLDTPFEILNKDDLLVWDYTVDETAECYELDEEGITYFCKIQEFCKENDLELILIKTPNPLTWDSSDHNTFTAFAKEHNVEFFDFNFAPLVNEIGYDPMFDSMDGIHLNYYGSQKFALWFGNYLIENGYAHDIRGEEKYAFMEEDLAAYKEEIGPIVALHESMDVADYLSIAVEKENYVVFVSVMSDASTTLTNEQRAAFSELGLSKLSNLGENESYIAVVEAGDVSYEQIGKDGDRKLRYSGELSNMSLYSLVSGGSNSGNTASIKIEGSEYAPQTAGINVVVYDLNEKTVVDIAVFDTGTASYREVPVWDVLENALSNVKADEEIPPELEKYVAYLELLEGEE